MKRNAKAKAINTVQTYMAGKTHSTAQSELPRERRSSWEMSAQDALRVDYVTRRNKAQTDSLIKND